MKTVEIKEYYIRDAEDKGKWLKIIMCGEKIIKQEESYFYVLHNPNCEWVFHQYEEVIK